MTTTFIRIAGGGMHSLLLDAGQQRWAMGNDSYGQSGDGHSVAPSCQH